MQEPQTRGTWHNLRSAWGLARKQYSKGDTETARWVARNLLLPPLLALALISIQVLALTLLWRWLGSRAVQGDLATSVYYTLSTVAQTTAAMSGLLLAFVALRLPRVLREAENDQVPEGLEPLAKALVEGRIRIYKREREVIIRRTVLALTASFVAIAGSLVGLPLTPWLDAPEQTRLLALIVGLALVALNAQAWMLWPSLRAMRGEARRWWRTG